MDLGTALDPDNSRLPPAPPVRYAVRTALTDLLLDPFWESILRDTPADAAIYGYCVLSGVPKIDAAAIATDLHTADPMDLALVVQALDREAAPVFRRGMLAGGLNEFQIVRTIREIMEDPGQAAPDRLRAVQHAMQMLGKGPILPTPVQVQGDVHVTVNNTRVDMHTTVHAALQDALSGIEGGTGLQIPLHKSPAVIDAKAEEVPNAGSGPGPNPGL